MSADWRERFLKLNEELEHKQQATAETERELVRLVTRLCVACTGFDAALDPHLKSLRNAARKGNAESVLREAADFADSVVHTRETTRKVDLFHGWLNHLKPAKALRDQLEKAWTAVAADPANASEAQLDRLGELMRTALSADERKADTRPEAARGGLLSRLIGTVSGDASEPPNRVLLDLISDVEWPGSLTEQIDGFRAALANDNDDSAWVEVVRQLSDVAVRSLKRVDSDARTTESFLQELNVRLEQLDLHMDAEGGRREAARHSGEMLGRGLNDEVVSLTSDVHDSADLTQLRSSVLTSLERMQNQVRQHIEGENRRRAQAESEAAELRAKMHKLEKDSFDLRRQVAQRYLDAMRDPLTGLPNRRAYDERIAQEHARWKRFADPLALLVMDIDNFKQVNDTFGHKSGDKALVMIGKTLQDRLRETDFIARYGGEEFVVILTGAPADHAFRLADALREAVAQCGLHANGKPVPTTVSCGLALFVDGDSPEQVFERADRAMYRAKQRGKNQVIADLEMATS